MKSYELLDVLGDVNEDYVRAADANVVRPRFRWKALVACAACGLLVLAAYPAYRAGQPKLHDYTVMEGGVGETLETDLDEMVRAPAGGPAADSAPEATMINGADKGGASMYKEPGAEIDGSFYNAPTEDASVQEAAMWYDALLKIYRLEENPEWYGGAWIAGDRLLAVAIVDGFRTQSLEAELQEAAGADAVLQFSTVKYSHAFLNSLMEQTAVLLDGTGLSCGIGVHVMDNCVGVDLYGDGAAVPDDILAELAQLDPDGDAIRVRLFTGKLDALTDKAVKGSAPDVPLATPALTKDDAPHPTPVDGDKVYHGENIPADAVPGGAYVGELPQAKEEGQSAHYDLLPLEE